MEAGEQAPAAVRPGSRTIVARFAVVIALVVLDLWSKASVFEWLNRIHGDLDVDVHGHVRFRLLGDWLGFMLSTNKGAAFGQLAASPHLLIGGRILAVLFLTWMVGREPRERRIFTIALMLVLAGAAGNLWDNLFLPPPGGHPYGAVRDFIDVFFTGIGDAGWHFPTFNVADSCITIGAVLLLLSGLDNREKQPVAAPAPESVPEPEEVSVV